MIRVLASLLLFNFSGSSQPKAKPQEKVPEPFWVVGFNKGTNIAIEKYDIDKLTHLIFCFIYLQGNKINIKNAEDAKTLKRFVTLKTHVPIGA